VGSTVTYLTELLVGAVCVGLALVSWRRPGTAIRVVSVVLGAAGLAAIAHAGVRLAQ